MISEVLLNIVRRESGNPSYQNDLTVDQAMGIICEAKRPGILLGESVSKCIEKWWLGDSIIGKILKFVYHCPQGVTREEFEWYVQELGSTNWLFYYKQLYRTDSVHCRIFQKIDDKVFINSQSRKYIDLIERKK